MSKIIINIENIYFTPERAFQEPTRNRFAEALVGAMFAASAPLEPDADPASADEEGTFAGGDGEDLTAEATAQPDAPPAALRERVLEFLKGERYKYRTYSAIRRAMGVTDDALDDALDELELEGEIETLRRRRDGVRLFGLA
jgi:hypothetical protein